VEPVFIHFKRATVRRESRGAVARLIVSCFSGAQRSPRAPIISRLSSLSLAIPQAVRKTNGYLENNCSSLVRVTLKI